MDCCDAGKACIKGKLNWYCGYCWVRGKQMQEEPVGPGFHRGCQGQFCSQAWAPSQGPSAGREASLPSLTSLCPGPCLFNFAWLPWHAPEAIRLWPAWPPPSQLRECAVLGSRRPASPCSGESKAFGTHSSLCAFCSSRTWGGGEGGGLGKSGPLSGLQPSCL